MAGWCYARSVFFFFFPSFLWTFYVVFRLLTFWPLCSVRLFPLFFFFLLFFLTLIHRLLHVHAWGVPGHPLHPRYWPICSVALMCRPRHPCSPISAHTPLPKLWPTDLYVCLFVLFCVCWVLMHPPAPIRTHPHPPESLLTLLCLHTYMCLFGGNFPAIHGRESYPASLFLSLFVSFVCALVMVHPTIPIKTHKHP